MDFVSTELGYAAELDRADPLAGFREKYYIADDDIIYLDGNSLGRLPINTIETLESAIRTQWGERLIRSWNEQWIHASQRASSKIARLIGAGADEVLVADSTSINLFKLVLAALQTKPDRKTIVSDTFNFPSDLYIIQGVIRLLGNQHDLLLIQPEDGITISPREVQNYVNADTALVCLTHVAYKNAFMYDMNAVTEIAHQAGALMLWDLSHSIGAVPVDLDRYGVDLAVGCTYKYLNAGPGAPAFLFIRKRLQADLWSPIYGWFGADAPFDFNLEYKPAAGIERFLAGTPSILSTMGIEPAVDIHLEAGIDRLRRKSIQQTEYLIYLVDHLLGSFGVQVASPRDPAQRGSHVSLRHPEAYRISQAMIEHAPPAPVVIPDFRAPDLIRLGIAPIYNSFVEINLAVSRIKSILEHKSYEKFSTERAAVT